MLTRRFHHDILRRLAMTRERMHAESHEDLGIPELARTACLSEQHFVRVFRAVYGQTPGRYLTGLRIEHAKLLLSRDVSVTDACMMVGYSSLGSFSRCFARDTSVSPRVFQRRMRAFGAVPARLTALYIPACFVARFSVDPNVRFGEVAS